MALKFRIFFLLSVILLVALQEGEARRMIVKGRKTITRYYYKEAVIPAWAVVLMVALGELVVGGLLYVGLKFCILDPPLKPQYVPAPSTP